jgi:uncharacterized pyridoxamine 5'-phosphate oxidase family protein
MHQGSFDKLFAAPQKFTFEIAFHVAEIFETDRKEILDLFYNQTEGAEKKVIEYHGN